MHQIIPRQFQISPGAVNCFIIDDGPGGLVLVDTGYTGSTGKIFAAIEKSGRSPGSINRIILTHSHPDHAGSVADIAEKTGAKLSAHPADAALIEQGIAGRLPHVLSPGIINWLIFNLFTGVTHFRIRQQTVTPFGFGRPIPTPTGWNVYRPMTGAYLYDPFGVECEESNKH